MVRRWLAAVLVFAAVAACTKQYTTGDTPNGDDDDAGSSVAVAPRDAGTSTPTDSGTSAPVDAGPTACTTCPCARPTTTPTLPSIATGTGAPCSQADLNLYLAGEGKPFDDAKAAMAAENNLCAACIFTHQGDAHWGPVVKTDDGRRFVSFGTCYLTDGAHAQCANAWHAFEWCRQAVCNVCLDGVNPQDCFNDAESNECADELSVAQGSCSNNDQAIVTGSSCAGSGDVVKLLCGPH